MAPSRPRPAVLCILDGWGHRPDPRNNAILDARTPNFDRLVATCPQGLIDASESFVGLPRGQMGNSEVGHMNLGAGRVAVPDMPRIDKAIEEGSLGKNPVLTDLVAALKKSGGACHLMGLASPGGVHAHQDHLVALANMIAAAGVPVWIHAFLDGRDTPPRSAQEYLEQITGGLKKGLPIRFATISGRYYAMDRDKRWERVEKAYTCLVDARAETAKTPRQAVEKAYAAGQDDEFVMPTALDGYPGMKDGDGVLMFNYRSDRAREILTALLDPMFDGFHRLDRCRQDAGMADHVGVGIVHHDQVVLSRADGLDELVRHLRRAHLGLEVVGRDLRRGHQHARLARVLLLDPAVEKERHVGVFFGFSNTQLRFT